ncbi:MAG: TM0106 family RecB-like putative nuclease [Candidatus Cloacimonetes bacterium]|nr:TM0106 family RecB-like putative nuclease [Candidatus Cloacimonadota bacterium]
MVTNKQLFSFLICEQKAFLLNDGQRGETSEYEQLHNKLLNIYKKKFFGVINNFKQMDSTKVTFSFDLLSPINHSRFIEPFIKNEEYYINIDFIEVDTFKQNNIITGICYSVIPFDKISRIDKIYLVILILIINSNSKFFIETGKIIYGKKQKSSRIKISSYQREAKEYLRKIAKVLSKEIEITPFWKKHCSVCEFNHLCIKKFKKQDNLSLLTGLSQIQINKLNRKGIFTINQFSYTYKPKKRPSKQPIRTEFALKALAIREKKTYIKEIPKLPLAQTKIFLDFETLYDEDFYYLIGMNICSNGNSENYSFWSDAPKDFESNFVNFLLILKDLDNYIVFHYGSYEIRILKKIDKQLENKYSDQISLIIKNSFNVLSLFASHIYPPTYSNSLKEIAKYLGFIWSSKNASGIQSIVWRKTWELSKNINLKNKLTTYNAEDCLALKIIIDWIALIEKTQMKKDNNFINVSSIKKNSYLKWGKQKFQLKDFDKINKCAYFDYQRNKIYLRTNKNIKKAIQGIKKQKKNKNKINKIIKAPKICCPNCGNISLQPYNKRKSILINLKFMENGIKKWVTQFPASSYKCTACSYIFGFKKFGRNLMIWSMNQYVSYFLSVPKIQNMLREYLNIYVPEYFLYDFKSDLAQEYLETYNNILNTLINGDLIHIDETKSPVMKISNSYVWVLTNMDTVFYMFRPNRKAEFLKEMLKEFQGVIVSDFFSGYYSLPCQQQKCLIHLIRDLNNDLLVNQFNKEFKDLVSKFGVLLKKVIETIDKYGLRKKYLLKHQIDIDLFFDDILQSNFETEIAFSYQKRFKRNKGKLFNFINYDNIPWNNNNAENAIKPFAKFRARTKGILREKGLKDFLILLSIQQTCIYRGINFLEFLKNKCSLLDLFPK